ncbi:sulfatase family protein [Nocardia sp. NPDC004711]
MPLDDRPNILWIVSEDCPPRFGCYGDELAQTPNLDRLAREGVVFEHAFSVSPVCAPSRFAMLTGLRPESHAPANHMRARAPMPSWLRTYPEILREQGYYCTNNAKTDYNSDVDPDVIWNESSRTAHWRNRAPGSPFLAVFNFDGTHESSVFRRTEPARVDPEFVRVPAYLPDTPEIRGDIARYYDNIDAMDAFVGDLLAQLDEDGLADTTIVIHTSDHGGVNPRSKRFCYDEGLRVPLIIRAPRAYRGLFPAPGTRVSAAVTTDRIPATVIDLAGAQLPAHMRGNSLARTEFDRTHRSRSGAAAGWTSGTTSSAASATRDTATSATITRIGPTAGISRSPGLRPAISPGRRSISRDGSTPSNPSSGSRNRVSSCTTPRPIRTRCETWPATRSMPEWRIGSRQRCGRT